jgi:hypothetical protein
VNTGREHFEYRFRIATEAGENDCLARQSVIADVNDYGQIDRELAFTAEIVSDRLFRFTEIDNLGLAAKGIVPLVNRRSP